MEKSFQTQAIKVSAVSIIVNLLLSVLKLTAGLLAHSGAMVSDAVHSASDVFSSFIVIIGVKLSARESDRDHPYGHERLECAAAILLSAVLAMTGLAIGYNSIQKIVSGNYSELMVPGSLALAAAAISILVKELMFWYTRHYAKKLDSAALMADAWHHRSDSLSSVGALIGIGGAMLGFPIMEPLASLLIFLFIAKAAWDIFKDALDKMVDRSCGDELENAIADLVIKQDGVMAIDLLRTRMFGNRIYVDLEIAADGSLSLIESHEIAERIHDILEKDFPRIKHIMVHVNPIGSCQP